MMTGLVLWLVRLVRQPTPERFLFTGLMAAFGLAMIFMTLRVPSYAQAKAFYLLPALLRMDLRHVSVSAGATHPSCWR